MAEGEGDLVVCVLMSFILQGGREEGARRRRVDGACLRVVRGGYDEVKKTEETGGCVGATTLYSLLFLLLAVTVTTSI